MENRIKAIYISIVPLYAIVALVMSLLEVNYIGFTLDYTAAVVPNLTILLFFSSVFITDTPRTDTYLKIPSLLIFLPGLLGLIQLIIGPITLIHIFPVISAIVWAGYLFWYSRFENRLNTINVNKGDLLPEFLLMDLNGNVVSSNNYQGKTAIYLFYRGNWCPLCMAQVKELVRYYKQLEKRGVSTVLISPQPQSHSQSLADKYDVSFDFMVDKDNLAAEKLGINQDCGLPLGLQLMGYSSDTVLPTVIITDEKGKILHMDLTDNYRIRPEPEIFLEILDEHKGKPVIQLM